MSNASITAGVLEAIAAYESGQSSASLVAVCIEIHEPALEVMPRKVRDKLYPLSVQLIEQDISPRKEALLGIAASRQALDELKSLLDFLA